MLRVRFDDWPCPFVVGSAVERQLVLAKLAEKLGLLERVCLGGIGLLVLLGLAARRLDRAGRLEAFLTRPEAASERPLSVWQRPIPGPVLGVCALLALVLFGVVAMYLYYPPPETVFEDMTAARVNTVVSVRTRQQAESIRRLEHWDLLTRKLQVGVFIRTGRLDE